MGDNMIEVNEVGINRHLRFNVNAPMADNKSVKTVPKLESLLLLAEDNVINQKLVSRLVSKLGLTVVIVNDGVEVCELCEK